MHSNEDPKDEEGADASEQVRYTVPSEPPTMARRQRRSWWPGVLDEVRQFPGEWRLLLTAFAESTARQVASDIRNAHKKDPQEMRIRGVLLGERWDASVAAVKDRRVGAGDGDVQFGLWLMYLGDEAA